MNEYICNKCGKTLNINEVYNIQCSCFEPQTAKIVNRVYIFCKDCYKEANRHIEKFAE